MAHRPVIAIDGPAGAGKSTVSKLLAAELGLTYLDTGAMYRAAALKAVRLGIRLDDGAAAAEMLGETAIGFGNGAPPRVLMDGEDVTGLIRTPEVSECASALSSLSPVRRALVALQQAIVANGGVVVEGRDATTVIAPNADLKVFMTASLEERAKRRAQEFGESGLSGEFQQVRQEIEQRDHRDITRQDSPLRVAPDAHVVETAGRSIHEVVAVIRRLLALRELRDCL